jgi:hypothetical protein
MLALLTELLDSFTYRLVAVVSVVCKILCIDSETMAINMGTYFEDLGIVA